MARFKVLTPLKLDGKNYSPGKSVEMDPAEAAKIPWAVEPLISPAQKNGGEKKGESEKK